MDRNLPRLADEWTPDDDVARDMSKKFTVLLLRPEKTMIDYELACALLDVLILKRWVKQVLDTVWRRQWLQEVYDSEQEI